MDFNERLIFKNERGDSLEISYHSKLVPEVVTGLDSVDNTILSTESFSSDGLSVNGTKVKERNVVINGLINGDKQSTKEKMLRFFNPKQKLQLKYVREEDERLINCYVEKTPAFSYNGAYRFVVSFICPKPYWYSQEIKTDIAQWVGAFEFPLEIPEETGILMGYREPSVIVNVNNTSDNPAPMKLEFRAVGTLTNPTILNVETQEFIKIEREMVAGDVITLSTEKGSEYVRLTRGGVVSNIFNSLTLDSNPHFEIDVGDNLIRYDADTNVDNLEVSIYFTPQFVGV